MTILMGILHPQVQPRESAAWWRLSILMILVIGAVRSVEAGYVESKDGKTIIHIKVAARLYPDPAIADIYSQAMLASARLFRERFPQIIAERYRDKYKADPQKYGDFDWDNVELSIDTFSGITVPGVETDMLAIAGDLAPDVFYILFRHSSTYIEHELLYPLDKPEDGYLSSMSEEELELRVHPKIWPVIRRKGVDGQTRVWALPWGGMAGKVLLFRKDLFDENNLAYPDNNWTWEQLLEACRTITDPPRNRYGILLARGARESWHWTTFLWSAGGDIMRYDEATDRWRCTFDTREAAVALDYYLRLSAERWTDEQGRPRRGYSSKDASEDSGAWSEGRMGMQFGSMDEKIFARINPDTTGLVAVPLGFADENGRRTRGGELNSRLMGMYSQIKNPVVRDAAWEYMRFSENPESLELKTRVLVEGGFGRFVNPRYLKMFGYDELVRLSPKGWSETFEIAIETGKPQPYGKGSNLIFQMLTYPIQDLEQMLVDGKLPLDEEARLDVIQGVLKKWNARANEILIGTLPPEKRFWRRVTGWIALGMIAITFILVFRNVMRTFTPPGPSVEGKTALRWGFRKYWVAYVVLLPAVATVLVWHYVPLAWGSVMAFQDYRLLGESTWVGVDHFADLLWDVQRHGWWDSVWNSLRYSMLVVALTFLPPIVLAILLQEIPVGTLFFRTVFYLPAVITGLVTILLWKMFYDSSEHGTLNMVVMTIPAGVYMAVGILLLALCVQFARRLWFHGSLLPAVLAAIAGVVLMYTTGALAWPLLFPEGEALTRALLHLPGRLVTATHDEPYRWLTDRNTAMLACVIPMVWAGIGPGCLIYLAALRGIADDLYEAAEIDGATFIDKIAFIVFPILKALIIITFVGVFIGSWQGAANILAMTGGAAGTQVADLKIFYEAFMYMRMGPATAMAWTLGFILIGFTVYQLRILSRLEFRTTGTKE
jgi:multiple sugar transport system permease protein